MGTIQRAWKHTGLWAEEKLTLCFPILSYPVFHVKNFCAALRANQKESRSVCGKMLDLNEKKL